MIDGNYGFMGRRKVVAGAAIALGTAACAFLVVFLSGQTLDRAALWAAVLGLPVAIVAAAAAVWAVIPWRRTGPVPPELEIAEWVDRPVQVANVVAALLHRRSGAVAIATGLYGAGGFGKTTLARMVCADERVRRRFGGRVFWVTVGRDLRDAAALTAKVNDVIKLISGEEATFTDPELASARLGALLDAGPWRLLVLDDVWDAEQLAPFARGGWRCSRLVTTRVPGLLAERDVAVLVDQMSPVEAKSLLLGGLPPLDPEVAAGLLAVTGRWPLLLRLASRILANAAQAGTNLDAAAAQLLERLQAGGPKVVDDLLADRRTLDVGDSKDRARAVRVTIGAGISLLDQEDARRFAELGVFAEDETIPVALIARLWQVTTEVDFLVASQLCARLVELGLVSRAGENAGGVVLHDVVRDFLRADLGPQQLAMLAGNVLDAVAEVLLSEGVGSAQGAGLIQAPWWELGGGDRYMQAHLIGLLMEAGRSREAEALACDLRWVGARVRDFGPAAAATDLSLVGTTRTVHLLSVLSRAAHLLAPTDPPSVVIDVLHSRVSDDSDWGAQAAALRDQCRLPRLINRWPLPDLPDPALRRVLTGHADQVDSVMIAPDGGWLASRSFNDGTVRIWDPATGRELAVLIGHKSREKTVKIAPDGSWVVTSGEWHNALIDAFYDGTKAGKRVKIWDAATGRCRFTLPGRYYSVDEVVISPDSRWLATASHRTVKIWDAVTGRERLTLSNYKDWIRKTVIAPDCSWVAAVGGSRNAGTLRIWDAATGRERDTHIGPKDWATASTVAVASDCSWLATSNDLDVKYDGEVKIWDVASGRQRASLSTGHRGWVSVLAAAQDGSWLATTGGYEDETARIWDVATGQERAAISGKIFLPSNIAISPDCSWMATGGGIYSKSIRVVTDQALGGGTGSTGTVQIFDIASGQEKAALSGHTDLVRALAVAPDGSWLATGSSDQTVRIWDATTLLKRASVTRHSGPVNAIAIAPSSNWLAMSSNRTVQTLDAATGRERLTLTGHEDFVNDVVIAPNGTWLASRSYREGAIRIWDAATGRQLFVLAVHEGQVDGVAIAPDSSWLATVGGSHMAGKARIWDAATGHELFTLTGHKGRVNGIVIAPDGSWLATGCSDGTVRIWDTATGHVRLTLAGRDWTQALVVAPDGSWLSAGTGQTVRMWDTASGRERLTLTGHDGPVSATVVSPDGAWLATRSYRETIVRIWDTATGRERLRLTGHDRPVSAMAIAPDGAWLATGSSDKSVRVWDTVTGRTQALMRIEDTVLTCVWSDASGLAVGGSAGPYLFDFLTSTPAGEHLHAHQERR